MLNYRHLLIAAAVAAVAACGGGGVDTVSYRPPPTPAPAPTPSPTPSTPADVPAGAVTAFDIVNDPPDGKLAVAGVSADGGLGDPQMLATASLAPADQPQMRYDAAANTYELKLSGGEWSTLWVAADALHPDILSIGNTYFIIGLNLYPRPGSGDAYSYSRIAWTSGIGTELGMLAFGVPTPASGVPASGSATYDGVISGDTDIFEWEDGGYPGYVALGVEGKVTLSFDFAGGTLSGSMEPMVGSENLGVFTFKNGVYSAGAYSGEFNSTVKGLNGFYGQLTGPHGEELIGGWALPFHYAGDNRDHQAIGAWIAKH